MDDLYARTIKSHSNLLDCEKLAAFEPAPENKREALLYISCAMRGYLHDSLQRSASLLTTYYCTYNMAASKLAHST